MARDLEEDILPLAKELDIGFVAYSPLARGLLTATQRKREEMPQDWRTAPDDSAWGNCGTLHMCTCACAPHIYVSIPAACAHAHVHAHMDMPHVFATYSHAHAHTPHAHVRKRKCRRGMHHTYACEQPRPITTGRYAAGNMEHNVALADKIAEYAKAKGLSAAQLSLAWLLGQEQVSVVFVDVHVRA